MEGGWPAAAMAARAGRGGLQNLLAERGLPVALEGVDQLLAPCASRRPSPGWCIGRVPPKQGPRIRRCRLDLEEVSEAASPGADGVAGAARRDPARL